MPYPMLAVALITAALVSPTPAFIVTPAAAQADSVPATAQAGNVEVTNAWARASAGSAATGAAYMTMVAGAQPDQLLSVTTPAATRAEVHESFTDNGVMKMRPAPRLDILPGKPLTLAPGGYHIMLLDLKQPLKPDRSFPITLTFAHAGSVTVDVRVRPLGQAHSAHDGMDMH